jgi:orotate phosphoribosyltransferase/orotidine-5'-phosphate decarboxylase
MNFSHLIAEALLNKGAVKVSLDTPFTWTSGIKSPIYCDNRLMISHSDARKVILDGFEAKILELGLKFDYLAGTATAGIPWAAFLAERLQVPMVYVRSAPKAHGAGKQVEGDAVFLHGKKALVIEDLISTGGSSINTAVALRNELEASDVFVLSIFEYGFPVASEKFSQENVDYAALSNFKTLLEVSELNETEQATVLKFAENPQTWFESL